jgi:DNA (cytosine-5)-methyltransferase 1
MGDVADGVSARMVGRLAVGVPNRVNKLRALGNAVCPQQCFPILTAIREAL